MTFLYPIGLLGLIGIPILIIVYLIKNRYTEQTIASTYLWRLSEKFLKRRNPLSRITGIISLILQLLLVATLSLAVAHPVITLPGAAREYCFILDASASMNMESGGKTRFELAKEEILDLIGDSKDGSTYTVVLVGETTEVIIEESDSEDKVADRLRTLKCSDCTVGFAEAIGIAQGYFNKNSSALTYLVTDVFYAEAENINVINVARGEKNVSLEDVTFTKSGKSTVTVRGNVVSYGADALLDVELYSDGSDTLISSVKVQAFDGVATPFVITADIPEFYSLRVKIPVSDAYADDNVAVVYDVESENAYNALLISDTPFLFEAVLDAVSNANIETMTVEEYKELEVKLAESDKTVSGYSLYIYDAYSPSHMPKDGSVWFVGINGNVDGSGFSIQSEITLDSADTITLTDSTVSTVRKFTAGMLGDDIYVSKYVKYGLYSDFTTIYSYKGNPVVFTGVNTYGNREVVFAFSLHDSDIVLSHDYLVLVGNLLDYSFPEVIETTEYYCGDSAVINVVSGCESIRVETPGGQISYADTSLAVSEFLLNEAGEYKITVNVSGAERPAYYLYSSVPKEERATSTSADYIGIQGEASNEGSDGRYDPLTLLFVLAALLFTAEWMVYCYDKYQL